MVVDDDNVDLNKIQTEEPDVKDNGPPSAPLINQDHYLKLVFSEQSAFKIFQKEKAG